MRKTPTIVTIALATVALGTVSYFVVSFTAPPSKLPVIEDECRRDVDVIRKRIYKAVEPDSHDCRIEEEIKPAPYRLEVVQMIEEARKREAKKPSFKFNTGLDYYPFQR
ncbi:ribosomal protein, S6 [Nesidiocoris tenuis]|uniref:Ribosomal protein, S6 n=1 Tax=Nesidiocoris tenuis TaxID=355587 RepID=A0ABN7B9V7_9HEMI|nr:ribosomal protein, S6 [Nesidiocoris tenuis]